MNADSHLRFFTGAKRVLSAEEALLMKDILPFLRGDFWNIICIAYI
jgi:hypothetical protein